MGAWDHSSTAVRSEKSVNEFQRQQNNTSRPGFRWILRRIVASRSRGSTSICDRPGFIQFKRVDAVAVVAVAMMACLLGKESLFLYDRLVGKASFPFLPSVSTTEKMKLSTLDYTHFVGLGTFDHSPPTFTGIQSHSIHIPHRWITVTLVDRCVVVVTARVTCVLYDSSHGRTSPTPRHAIKVRYGS